MKYQSPEWKAKILDPQTAMRWADSLKGTHEAGYFCQAFNMKAVFGPEFSEYRYWATGVHEPEKDLGAKGAQTEGRPK